MFLLSMQKNVVQIISLVSTNLSSIIQVAFRFVADLIATDLGEDPIANSITKLT